MPSRWRPATELGARYHRVVPAVWHLVIALLILNRFWYYWHTLP